MNRMKRFVSAIVAVGMVLLLSVGTTQAAEKLKPFVLGSVSKGELGAKVNDVKRALVLQGFTIAGEYAPYKDAYVVVVTSNQLKAIAAKTPRGGYAAAQRVSVTQVGDQVQVAYVNPIYLQYAYHLGGSMSGVADRLANALGKQEEFGAKGLTQSKLKNYHYTFGMEYFEDPYKLAKYSSYREAVAAVERGLAAKNGGVSKVYRVDIPGKEVSVFGVSMVAGETGNKYMDDQYQMTVVDHKELKGTAYLPYEIMVIGNRVEALHMRYRMAVHFPDLKMAGKHSFMKLMPSPEAIKKSLTLAAGAKVAEEVEPF